MSARRFCAAAWPYRLHSGRARHPRGGRNDKHMSLINDALKRATQEQPSNRPAAGPETPMQPVERRRGVGLPVYFIPVLLFILSGACFFLLKGWETRRQAGFYPQPISVQARSLSTAPA